MEPPVSVVQLLRDLFRELVSGEGVEDVEKGFVAKGRDFGKRRGRRRREGVACGEGEGGRRRAGRGVQEGGNEIRP